MLVNESLQQFILCYIVICLIFKIMEKQNVPGSPSVINQKGDYLVLLNSKCVGEEGLSTFVFASDLSLEAAVFMSLNLYKTVPQSVVYVVHRETRDLFESFYTLRLVSDEK